MSSTAESRYPLLREILALRGLTFQPTYTNRQGAEVFGVTIRTIQARCQNGDLIARDLPGRARFLPSDLEEYLSKSRKVR